MVIIAFGGVNGRMCYYPKCFGMSPDLIQFFLAKAAGINSYTVNFII